MRGGHQDKSMEDRSCSVCCDVKAKPAIRARPWRTSPNKLLQQALLACTLSQRSGEKSSATSIASSTLKTYVDALNSYAAVMRKHDTNRQEDYQEKPVNDRLVNWLYDIRSCSDLLDGDIPIEYASHPFILNIKKLGVSSDFDSEVFEVHNLCESCEKLIRNYAFHESKFHNIAISLFKATVKSLINPKKSRKPTSIQRLSNKENITHKAFLNHNIAACNPTSKNDIPCATAASLVPKRKRGRPRKVPSALDAANAEQKKSELNYTKSICPFCSKVYSIEHSFVHNCLAYRNSLRCVRCNVFSSTYVRFEKHLEVYHHEKRHLCCQVSNCNQRFVSEPAFRWHSHFHTIEEKQLIYAVDPNVVCAASTVKKRRRLSDTCSGALPSKKRVTDDVDSPDVSSVAIICNDLDQSVSTTLECSDPTVLLLSESTLESVPQTVSSVFTNSSNAESPLSQLIPLSKPENQCSDSESQSLLCSYNLSTNCGLSSTQADYCPIPKPLLEDAHATHLDNQSSSPCRAGNDEQNSTKSTEPVFVFVGKRRNANNIITLNVQSSLTEDPQPCGSKYLSQQQFAPITIPDFSLNPNQMKVKEYYPSLSMDQVSVNSGQNTIPDTHLHPESCLFQCNNCMQYFSTQSALNVHRLSQCGKNSQQLFSCQRCSSSFLSLSNLKKHVEAHCRPDSDEGIALDPCQDSIKELGLAQHILMDHRVGEQQYQCPVCEQVFYVISDLVEHLNGHDASEICTCYICSDNIKSKPRETAEKDNFLTLQIPSQIWTCAICHVSFLTAEALKKHCTDADHNIGSLSDTKPNSQHANNLQMTHLDINYPVHQILQHDESLLVKQETDSAQQILGLNSNNNPSLAYCNSTPSLEMSCLQSAAKVPVCLSSHIVNHINPQPLSPASHATNSKQLMTQSCNNGSSSFREGRPLQLQCSDVVDTTSSSSNPVLAGRSDDFGVDLHPSGDGGSIVNPIITETETQSLFNSSQNSYCQGCGLVAIDQASLATHVRCCPLLQPKVEAPFVDDHFISTTENLSVIKALESSSGSALTSIDHLIGSVDDMDYFT